MYWVNDLNKLLICFTVPKEPLLKCQQQPFPSLRLHGQWVLSTHWYWSSIKSCPVWYFCSRSERRTENCPWYGMGPAFFSLWSVTRVLPSYTRLFNLFLYLFTQSEMAFMPSVGVEFVTEVGALLPEYVESGLEMHTNIYHESGLKVKVSVTKKQLKLTFPTPQAPTKLISVT